VLLSRSGPPEKDINIAPAGDRAWYFTSRSLTSALVTDVRTSERGRENNKSMETANCVSNIIVLPNGIVLIRIWNGYGRNEV
jgi:hypothetical protein